MSGTYFSKDTIELLSLLQLHEVQYVIVGGEAVIFYGYPRVTGDIDIFYDNSRVNSEKLYKAMLDFWAGNIPGMASADEFMETGVIIQFGQPPNRIDLINRIDGIHFNEAWESRVTQKIGTDNPKIIAFYIGLDQLIKNKKASGRYKDLDDLRFLEKKLKSGDRPAVP